MHYIKVVSKTWNLTLPLPKLHVANENKENTWLRISLSHSEHLRRSQSIFLTSSSLAMAMSPGLGYSKMPPGALNLDRAEKRLVVWSRVVAQNGQWW